MSDLFTKQTPAPAFGSALAVQLTLPANFPLALSSEQETRLQARLQDFRFKEMPLQDISTLALDSELALNRTLDGFLSRIDKQNAPQLFNLVTQLNTSVDDQKLPQIADRILNAKPSLLVRALGLVYPPVLKKASARLFEDISRAASGKTKTLADVVSSMETTLRQEMNTLHAELSHMDLIKAAYRESFVAFVEDTAFLHNALNKARLDFQAIEPELLQDHQLHQEAQDKLQALESRALAVEGTMSRLPSDQLVIRQLQNAGVGTLQELATTMASRFASIKMTLLTIHGALQVRGVQRLGEQGAALDANLSQVRGKLMTDVVTSAAAAPGKNRAQQALQLQQIVADTRTLVTLVDAARATNAKQFSDARQVMADARQEMLSLGKAVNPAGTVGNRTY
jgi:hypothetical protein